MPKIAVIHLARAKNGISPFARFLESYTANPGGIAHDLLVIFKGFRGEDSLQEYRKLLADRPHQSMSTVEFNFAIGSRSYDLGYDIGPYFTAMRKFPYEYYCLLNHHSTFLDDQWLVKMYHYISQENVGLVGATGSGESLYSTLLGEEDNRSVGHFSLIQTLRLLAYSRYFDPFPNYHIRTNAFMISYPVMQAIRRPVIVSKLDAYRFESGKRSLTNQVVNMGLRVLVVGKNGHAYEKEEWFKSGTFRQGSQSNLLVADNQTNAYLHGDDATKTLLSRYSWGDNAGLLAPSHSQREPGARQGARTQRFDE